MADVQSKQCWHFEQNVKVWETKFIESNERGKPLLLWMIQSWHEFWIKTKRNCIWDEMRKRCEMVKMFSNQFFTHTLRFMLKLNVYFFNLNSDWFTLHMKLYWIHITNGQISEDIFSKKNAMKVKVIYLERISKLIFTHSFF